MNKKIKIILITQVLPILIGLSTMLQIGLIVLSHSFLIGIDTLLFFICGAFLVGELENKIEI